jgi:hypothetical protein
MRSVMSMTQKSLFDLTERWLGSLDLLAPEEYPAW